MQTGYITPPTGTGTLPDGPNRKDSSANRKTQEALEKLNQLSAEKEVQAQAMNEATKRQMTVNKGTILPEDIQLIINTFLAPQDAIQKLIRIEQEQAAILATI
jgi:hypothetical protein